MRPKQSRPWGRLRYIARRSSSLQGLDVGDGDLARAAVGLRVEGDLLTLGKPAQAGALQSGSMHEHVLPAIIRLDEAETLLTIVEFHSTIRHHVSFRGVRVSARPHDATVRLVCRCLGGSERAPSD